MSPIDQIEKAVRQLTPDQLAAFRKWFAEYDADAWDKQLGRDAASGRLDALAEEATRDLREGRCKDL